MSMTARHVWAALAFGIALAPVAQAEAFKVFVDQTVTLKLAAPANSVVIGNATVADVAVHDPMTLLVTGKAFGSTNLLVLDRNGRTIYSNTLAVGNNDDNELTIIRGASGGANTYSCIDKCYATAKVGDEATHFTSVMTTVNGKAAAAKGQ
jgi:Flp pilus assembly secretin CpaC